MSEAAMTPAEQVRRLYEEAEARTAGAMEQLVASEDFAELLAMLTGNVMAATRLAGTWMDQLLANLHVAGRADVARLGRQLARTEDKLERLLQVVEELHDRLPPAVPAPAPVQPGTGAVRRAASGDGTSAGAQAGSRTARTARKRPS